MDDLTCTNCGEYLGSPIAARIEALEARIAKADALAEAHGKLWSALAEIIEAPGMSPNATVRRMAARAEKALVEDAIADTKPVPRFYREADT